MRVVRPVGEGAVLLEWTSVPEALAGRKARAVAAHLESRPPGGVREWTLGARSLLVVFEPERFDEPAFVSAAASWENDFAAIAEGARHEIPVCYGGAGGIDLEELAAERGISPEAFAQMHSAAEYRVAFLGFAPGFAYLTGLPAPLAAARLATPRVHVPWGSVAIGGPYTGVYPDAGPGGWRLIGRSPSALFDARRRPPALLSPGDRVRFVPIEEWKFAALAASRGLRG
ncbi:MAG TPA: 5-oxoprolinase subunit PxpB [Thermoanaerobaculia bacterium]|nr:5-oxoprolinase subunit PxpB [Thermoanaerobaculia bacterium]